MSQFEPFSMHPDDFNRALEAVMNNEAPVTHVKHADLSSHPIYAMLLEGPGELNPPHEGSVKMTLPTQHVPDVTIANRVKSIGEFFNSELSADHWQKLADQHPAAEFVRAELQEALDKTLSVNTDHWSTELLNPLMDRLDKLGFQTAFDKASMTFAIVFHEGCGVHVNDVQQDLRNKGLIDKINAGSSFLDSKPTVEAGETAQGWVDPVKHYNRTLVWKVKLAVPTHKAQADLNRVNSVLMNNDYVYTG